MPCGGIFYRVQKYSFFFKVMWKNRRKVCKN